MLGTTNRQCGDARAVSSREEMRLMVATWVVDAWEPRSTSHHGIRLAQPDPHNDVNPLSSHVPATPSSTLVGHGTSHAPPLFFTLRPKHGNQQSMRTYIYMCTYNHPVGT